MCAGNIACGADVNKRDRHGNSTLLHAARHKNNGAACMRLLFSAGANIVNETDYKNHLFGFQAVKDKQNVHVYYWKREQMSA